MSGFHPIHGKGVLLGSDGETAELNNPDIVVVFSDAPLEVNKPFSVQVGNPQLLENASLCIGVTGQDPLDWDGKTKPSFMTDKWCMETRDGDTWLGDGKAGECIAWREAFGEEFDVQEEDVVTLVLCSDRSLSILHNCSQVDHVFDDLPARPLWAVIEMGVGRLQIFKIDTDTDSLQQGYNEDVSKVHQMATIIEEDTTMGILEEKLALLESGFEDMCRTKDDEIHELKEQIIDMKAEKVGLTSEIAELRVELETVETERQACQLRNIELRSEKDKLKRNSISNERILQGPCEKCHIMEELFMENCYPMNGRKMAIMFDFHRAQSQSNQRDTTISMKQLFEDELDFMFQLFEGNSRKDVLRKLEALILEDCTENQTEAEQCACLVVIISSPVKGGFLLDSNGKCLLGDIIPLLHAIKHPIVKRIPKIIFIDSYITEKEGKPMKLMKKLEEHPAIPSDTMIAIAGTRCPSESVFLQVIADIFHRYHTILDVPRMMTRVISRLNHLKDEDSCIEILGTTFESRLTRDLYL